MPNGLKNASHLIQPEKLRQVNWPSGDTVHSSVDSSLLFNSGYYLYYSTLRDSWIPASHSHIGKGKLLFAFKNNIDMPSYAIARITQNLLRRLGSTVESEVVAW